MSEGEGRMSRWSRRKRQAAAAERREPEPQAPAAETGGEQGSEDLAGLPDAEVLKRLGLKDPDEMQPGDDFAAFLGKAVPEHLRRRALRRLWRSNPVLANLDGLNDYDTDFTGDTVAPGLLKTAYRVGSGLVRDLPEAAEDAERPEAAETDTAAGAAAEASDLRDMAGENDGKRQVSQADGDEMSRPRRRMRFDFKT